MKPTFSSIVAAKNGTLTVGIRTPRAVGDGLLNSRCSASLSDPGGQLSLSAAVGTPPGFWVYYHETRASYGLANGGETWAASGPFSGCEIAVGTIGGQVFLAHLAQQSGSTANEDWAGGKLGAQVWGRWKVPAPSSTFYSNSIVFIDWSKGANPSSISVVRVDLKTKSMGGFDPGPMEIFNVVQVA